ncbi:MAG TPA: DUF4349 domain-containing protein [Puia sp.]|nr:DUF4349 domain-containing protein [Puia sp.]
MPIPSRKRIRRTVVMFVALFVVLFLFRLLYGYYGRAPEQGSAEVGYDFFSNMKLRDNYASEKVANQAAPQDIFASQKYEKTATVRSETAHFDQDDSLIRGITKSYGGSIQYEQGLGKRGSRELHLSIGVKPDSFDSFYRAVQRLGELRSTSITKVDKTNEYRQLNAKKASLESSLESLNELKSKGGTISDFINLHDKVLEVETQLQELGVDLGNFNTENEFCTLRFSLFEGHERREVSFISRIKVALEWALEYYAILVAALAGVLLCSLLLLLIIDRLKILSTVASGSKE